MGVVQPKPTRPALAVAPRVLPADSCYLRTHTPSLVHCPQAFTGDGDGDTDTERTPHWCYLGTRPSAQPGLPRIQTMNGRRRKANRR